MVDICLLGNSSNLTVKFVEVEEIHPEFPEHSEIEDFRCPEHTAFENRRFSMRQTHCV